MAKSKPKIEQYHLHKDQPEKLQFEIYSLSDYLAKNVGHTDKPHIHSFYQIIWFTKGKGKHFVDFNEFEASNNKMFFISKNSQVMRFHLFIKVDVAFEPGLEFRNAFGFVHDCHLEGSIFNHAENFVGQTN